MSSGIEISKRLLLVNSASSVLARLINVVVLVWLHQFLLRRVSDEEYALLALLTSLILLLPLLTSVLTSGLGRFVVAAYAKGDERRVTQIVSTMFPLAGAAGVVLFVGGLVFAWHVDKVLTIAPELLWDARIMMALLVLAVAMRPVCAPFSVGLYVRQKFVLLNVITLMSELFRLTLLCVLLFSVSTRALWVVVANATAEMGTVAGMVVISRRLIPALTFRVGQIRWELAGELVSFGGWNFLALAAARLRLTAIPLILNKLATPLDVSTFYIGSLGRREIERWSDAAVAPLYPMVTGMHALDAKARIRNLYLRGGRIALWVVLAVAVPAMVYARELIHLYAPDKYIDAAAVMFLNLAIFPIMLGNWMVWPVANATGRIRPAGVIAIVCQGVIIAVTLYMVYAFAWGAVGAALIAFVGSAVATILLMWPLGLKLADVALTVWVRQTLVPGLLPALMGAVVWVPIKLLVRPDTWTQLGCCTLAGAACYAIVLLRFCLSRKDREDLGEAFSRVRGVVSRLLPACKRPWGRDRRFPA